MTTPPGDDERVPPQRSPLAQWAETIEMSFIEAGQSLTDPGTAVTFLRTLDVFQRTIQGSHAQGVIDDAQLRELEATIEGMRQVPSLVVTR
ncbi:hypothetical protein ACFYQT_39770 [Streptomyces tibetensis]|uniref:Uncharacterized protein n=1 Tax=Streptomyces tibetensis TaxID=2382123 RepID=A0ABW6N8A5_9ACTN